MSAPTVETLLLVARSGLLRRLLNQDTPVCLAERPDITVRADRYTAARLDLGEDRPGLRYVDLHPLTLRRWGTSRSDGQAAYGEAY